MRQNIDLAILELGAHQSWFDDFLQRLEPSLEKIRVHRLRWEQSPDMARPIPSASNAEPPAHFVGVRTDAFLRAQVQLRRFDALLLPVSLSTLGWTRQVLVGAPRGPALPILGALHDLRSGAVLDLLTLGLTDFVTSQPCPQAFRARVIHAISRAPRLIALREPTPINGRPRPQGQPLSLREPGLGDDSTDLQTAPVTNKTLLKKSSCAGCAVQVSAFGWPDQGFGSTKQRLIALFERQYLKAAMLRANGNITAAATKSRKNRRAFWELLRKHGMVTGQPTQCAMSSDGLSDMPSGVKSMTDLDKRNKP